MSDVLNIPSKNSYLTSKQWKEIVEYAQKFKDPEEFWNAIKNSGFSNLQEFYDESEGILRFSMDSDERYFYELEQLGL